MYIELKDAILDAISQDAPTDTTHKHYTTLTKLRALLPATNVHRVTPPESYFTTTNKKTTYPFVVFQQAVGNASETLRTGFDISFRFAIYDDTYKNNKGGVAGEEIFDLIYTLLHNNHADLNLDDLYRLRISGFKEEVTDNAALFVIGFMIEAEVAT